MCRPATLFLLAILAACHRTTAALPPDLASRFEAESIVRRADDQVFRYTVTKASVFIHRNEKVGLDLTASTRKATDVRRDGDRVIISAGSGQSRVSWSFRPVEDAEGWATAIRAVIAASPATP